MINVYSPEIFWLGLTIIMTAFLWIPQILYSIFAVGPKVAFLYPDKATESYAEWANRSRAAHNNAVENLIIFAPLVLLVVLLDIGTELTGLASLIYFVSRATHYLMHVFAIPLMRTMAFLIGFACQLIMGLSVISGL